MQEHLICYDCGINWAIYKHVVIDDDNHTIKFIGAWRIHRSELATHDPNIDAEIKLDRNQANVCFGAWITWPTGLREYFIAEPIINFHDIPQV